MSEEVTNVLKKYKYIMSQNVLNEKMKQYLLLKMSWEKESYYFSLASCFRAQSMSSQSS